MAVPARTIGKYTTTDLIGRGGFGVVYRATDAAHGREVAIKLLQGSLGETERRRFDRERQTMGRLGAHPNIVPVHDSGYTDEGEAYIVMELASGGSLRSRLERDRSVPWAEAVSIMVAVASATEAAHRAGVLHRDIKPDNILIDEYGNPKLSDFGIAAVANNTTATTSTTATLAHAAPELLQGQTSTAAVDIYAIASTLHTLITGSPPFVRPGDELVTAMITRALMETPPDLRPYGVPDAVATVIERALAKTAQDRQASAAELADQLKSAASQPSTAAPASAAAPTVSQRDATPPPLGSSGRADTTVPWTGDRSPALASSEGRGSSRALWAVVALLAIAVVGLGAVIALSGGGDDETATGTTSSTDGETSTTSDSTTASTTASTSTTPSTTASASTTTTVTQPVIVERSLNADPIVSVSSSAAAGVDACGEPTNFEAANVLDGDPATAWRTEGDGRGQRFEFRFSESFSFTSVGLVPGYAKVDPCDGVDRFFQNRRVVEARWTIGDEVIRQRLDPDRPVLQMLTLAEPVVATNIVLEILEVTPESERPFTAISDVELRGG